ncbi:MAG: DNA-directed RNA polymerase subunit omega [Bacteroidetes bacterium]|nr:DNA-directed RNA polymerase subunit omega [Bacteroidota bacterium]
MDFKKINADQSIVTRDIRKFDSPTGNLYEAIAIISKRANQVSSELKEEITGKLQEFNNVHTDNLEEVFENREQIEISKHYEKLPKPVLIAVQEFLDDNVYYRNPAKEAAASK